MKSNLFSKILGVGVSTGMVIALAGALFAAPVAADTTKWSTVNTPSWKDHVIEPGSDIYHYDVSGDDGNTIVALGAVNGSDDCGEDGNTPQGLTGSIFFDEGSISINKINDTTYEFSGSGDVDACYLSGQFTAVLDVALDAGGVIRFGNGITGNPAWGVITGEISDGEITWGGKLYINPADAPLPDAFQDNSPYSFGDDILCVENWIVQPTTWGDFIINGGQFNEPRVWKSTDGGVIWDNITETVQDADNLPGPFVQFGYGGVSIAPDDEDWVAVSGGIFDPEFIGVASGGGLGVAPFPFGVPATVASKDGADNFNYAGDMEDTDNNTRLALILDVEVSVDTGDDIHIIAVAGRNSLDDLATYGHGSVYRLDTGTWLTGSWEDTSFYDGWDSGVGITPSQGVVDGEFSPNFDVDGTYVCATVDDALPIFPFASGIPYIQTGDFLSKQWNDEGGFPEAVEVTAEGDTIISGVDLNYLGVALPDSYDGTDPGARTVFFYVNALNETGQISGNLFRLDNASLSPQVAPSDDPLLASIDVFGDADTGKMMIGELIKWTSQGGALGGEGEPLPFVCCEGVRVWHTEELDICCPKWELACKNPSGPYMAQVKYTPDGEKEYAITSGQVGWFFGILYFPELWGGLSDESAFSVSRDDGTSWDQLGLIDTDIDYLSDMAVCPDCSVIYLSTINTSERLGCENCDLGVCENCACDSVWRSFDDGKTWERIFHGDWSDSPNQQLLLRLPCESVENCCNYSDPSAPGGTIYLGIQDDDDIFYSRDCGQCWTKTQDTKIEIQDFAVETESTVYVLDDEGNVSKSTNFGHRWADSADTKAGSGHTITVCCGEGFVVVGPENGDDKVAWSGDGGDTWNQTDDLPGTGSYGVHVACATTCENIIYAATGGEGNGIYRTDITDGSWDDLNANQYGYYGIAVGKSDGTLYAATNRVYTDEDADLCDRVLPPGSIGIDTAHSGVARNLDPCETTCCGTEDWDYLICGMGSIISTEYFSNEPSALRICGCLTSATNTRLWAIDADLGYGYAVYDGTTTGALWTYEDCASKVGPTLLAPADGTVLDCMACEDCSAQPFTLKWDRMCNSCSYDIEIMDEDGNVINSLPDIELTGTGSCSFVFNPQNSEFSTFFSELVCGSNYKWHVREANTTCECIHSRWSATWTFTIATSSANGVKLIAPKMAATDTGTANIGFSWTSVPDATSYSFVLSPNANLSGALVSQEIGTTAFNYAGPLENGKTYYWQVKAWKGTTLLSTSPIGVFTVGPKPVEPQPPVVVEQAPTPVINIPAAQQITPTWIYAIIGVGAALAVVVIVLIVKSRRS